MAPLKQYRPERMQQAIEAVKKGSTVLKAARKFGVPRITLRNKITGISPIVCAMGPPSILTNEQERMLVKWLNDMSDRHCPVGKEHLVDSVQQFVRDENIFNPFTNDRPGKKWYYSFLKRHPGISERISKNFVKSKDITEENIKSWFSDIYDFLQKNNLQDILKDPRRIFTSDEASFYLNPKPKRVLVKRSASNIFCTVGTKKENPRVFLTANAAGQLAPPMVMFADQEILPSIYDNMPEGWGVGMTKTGWMCGTTFYEYMTNIFHPWLVENDIELPIIYFLDGDATHLTLQQYEFCSKNQIELLALYPNSTEILNPMDVALFRPLRAFWKKECNLWKMDNYNTIKKEDFGFILAKALKDVTPACIRNGFRVGGLFPFGHKYLETTEPDPSDIQFFNNLEKEITVSFTKEKIELFNTYYTKNSRKVDLPKEDKTLYTIWSKYKDKCKDVTEKSVGTVDILPHSDREYDADFKRFTIGLSSDNENDSEGADSEDCEQRRYLSLSEGEDEQVLTKQLPSNTSARPMFGIQETPLKIARHRHKDEKTMCKNTKKLEPRTIRELREFNKIHMKLMLKEQRIKQEPLKIKRKGEIDKKAIHNAHKRTKISIKTGIILKDTPEIEYDRDEGSTTPLYVKKETKERIEHVDLEESQDKQISIKDTVKKEIEDDSLIIYVTDDNVNILYY